MVAQWIKNPPANTGDTGLTPSLGRFHVPWSNQAHAPQLLSLSAAITEAKHLDPVLRKKRSHHKKKPEPCNKEKLPLTSTRDRPQKTTKTQCSQKKKKTTLLPYLLLMRPCSNVLLFFHKEMNILRLSRVF